MKSPDDVEDCNFVNVVDFAIVERLNSCCSKEEIKAARFKELDDKPQGLETTDITWLEEKQPFKTEKQIKYLDRQIGI